MIIIVILLLKLLMGIFLSEASTNPIWQQVMAEESIRKDTYLRLS